ncbi:MBOAT family O-acyltransferase [Sulfurimonas sp.]
MLFNSFEFIFFFLPISLFIYFYLNIKHFLRLSKYWIIFASFIFYSWIDIVYLPLLLLSIVCNYGLANIIVRHKKNGRIYIAKTFMQIGLIANIGLLAYFKYMDFFIVNINLALDSDIHLLYYSLPLAISFFTFQQIIFLVDSYEGLIEKKNILDYTVFVVFFPQLISGPIVHYNEIVRQFSRLKNQIVNKKNLILGFFIFSIGLFKKVYIADVFAVNVALSFDNTVALTLFEAWATSFSYTFQIYFDFSGYTDMAIGLAILFNIKLPQNFNSPYKATSMIDFWKRWHITLTNSITTYIYTPILKTFSQITFHNAMFATIIAFLISGVWHGASILFLIFGALHGFGQVVNHYWRKGKIKINKYLSWFITFNFINFAFIFFRADDWNDVLRIFSGMIGLNGIGSMISINYIYLLCAFFIVLFLKNTRELSENIESHKGYFYFSVLLFIISVFQLGELGIMNRNLSFIYFSF